MTLSGTFSTMPLPDLLQWVAESRKSGLLTIVLDLSEQYLEVDAGMVVAVGSEELPAPEFVRLATARGLDAGRLEIASEEARHTGRSLGDVLVANKLIDRGALDEIVRRLVEESLWQLFLWHEGRFVFTDVRPTVAGGALRASLLQVSPPIDAREVLVDGMGRLDEWRQMAALIPTDYTLVHALGRAADLPHVEALWSTGEPMSLGDLCVATGKPRREVVQQLYEAHKRGLLAVDSGVPGGESKGSGMAERLRVTALELLSARQYDEAATLLRSALDIEPYHAAARADLSRCRAEQLDELRAMLPAEAVPVARAELGQVGQSGLLERGERYLLARIDGRRDVRQLIDGAPMDELQTLRALRTLRHAGLITV